MIAMTFDVHRSPGLVTGLVRGPRQLVHGERALDHYSGEGAAEFRTCVIAVQEGNETHESPVPAKLITDISLNKRPHPGKLNRESDIRTTPARNGMPARSYGWSLQEATAVLLNELLKPISLLADLQWASPLLGLRIG